MIVSAIGMSAGTGPGLDPDLTTELTGEGSLHPAREAGTGGVMMTMRGLVVENGATHQATATNIVTTGEKGMSIMNVGGDLTVVRVFIPVYYSCMASAFGVTVIKHHMQNSLGEYVYYLYELAAHIIRDLQFVMACSFASREIRHDHHVHHQARPACEVLGALALTRLRVVLLPSESCLLPLSEDIFDQIFPKIRIHLSGLFLMGTRSSSNVLK